MKYLFVGSKNNYKIFKIINGIKKIDFIDINKNNYSLDLFCDKHYKKHYEYLIIESNLGVKMTTISLSTEDSKEEEISFSKYLIEYLKTKSKIYIIEDTTIVEKIFKQFKEEENNV